MPRAASRAVWSRRDARQGTIMTDRPSNAGVDRNATVETKPELEPKPDPKSEPEPTPESDLPPETEASDAAENEGRPADESDEDATQLWRRYLLGRFWHTALRFWTTPGYRIAWLL